MASAEYSTEPSITFRNIYELQQPQGRVVLFEVPAAPLGMPIAWKGHYYARAGESLTHLGLDKLDNIRQQTMIEDWSAQIIPNAIFDHLDTDALQKARQSFVNMHPSAVGSDQAKLLINKGLCSKLRAY